MKQVHRRIHIMRIVSALIVGVLIYNLFQLQVIQGEKWRSAADNNRFRHLVQTAPRGKIITADGIELAANVPGYNVALAHEPNVTRRAETIAVLANLLDVDAEEITEIVKRHRRHFEPVEVVKGIDFQTVLILEESRHLMPSLVIQIKPQRVYPEGTLLAHALGRTVDYRGSEGLEASWDEYLRGTDGLSVVQVNNTSRPVGDPVFSQPAIPGQNLHLTIDAGLQQAAQDALQRVLEKTREVHKMEDAFSGAVIVMDPNTGQILAMVSEPTFDANDKYNRELWDNEYRYLINRTINYRRPIGSTFKMLTGLAALEEGVVKPTETVRCTGRTSILNFTTSCYGNRAHGNVNMRSAIVNSCNIYFGTMGVRLGHKTLYEYMDKFAMSRDIVNAGFVDLSVSEQTRSLDYRQVVNSWVGGNSVQIAYGQLNEFNALQVANYVSMIANGGIHYRPYMVERAVATNGEITEFAPEILAEQSFNANNLQIIQQGMRDAARNTGNLRGVSVEIAGKTGTSQHRGKDSHAWWVGYAPYDNPELVIVAFMEHGGLGSRSAEIGRDIINYYFDRDGGQNDE